MPRLGAGVKKLKGRSMVNISYPDAGILCELPENMRYYVKAKATGE